MSMYDPIYVGWCCQHSNATGEIELPIGFSNSLDEIVALVTKSHAIECGYPGAVSVLCNLERRGGMCVASLSVCTFGFNAPHQPPPLLVVIHLLAAVPRTPK